MPSIEPILDVDRETGEFIQGWPRCKQSIFTILSTRLRMRVMRLWWGSEFLNMQDKPGNQETLVKSIVAALQAIDDYEPEFKVNRLTINKLGPDGHIVITVTGDYLPDKAAKKLNVTF